MFRTLLKNTDYIIVVIAIILALIGIVGIYSAGYNDELTKNDYLKQLIWLGISIVALIVIWFINYDIYGVLCYPLYIVSIGLLVAVLFTEKVKGASSWFNFGGINFQPSEIAKITYILMLSKFLDYILSKDKKSVNKWYNILIVLGIFAAPLILIILQPDFGTALVFISITIFMLFKAGISYKYILIGILSVVIIAPLVYSFVLNDTQKQRVIVFLNPEEDPLGSGYNAIQSKMAVGSGMIFGTGLLKGTQTQYGYLPVKSSDFIFSVLSEEMGFVMSTIIVILYTVLLLKILKIAKTSKDMFGSLISIGIFGMILFHLLENIGMTIGLMPITGIPLPFVSYGGSSLLTNFVALGIATGISARRQKSLFID